MTAVRVEHSPVPGSGHLMFLRHMLVKKLEDCFFREKIYKYAHIPRPLGSISRQDDKPIEACLYEWAFGNEGFPWEVSEYSGGKLPVRLRDWNQFVEQFHRVGIDVGADVADSNDAKVSKNIIHQFPFDYPHEGDLNPIWKHIDFGPASAPMDYEKIMRFLCDNREPLIDVLRGERYRMMVLAAKYLDWSMRNTFRDYEFGELETLVGYYRLSSLHHHISQGGCNSNGQPYSEDISPTLFHHAPSRKAARMARDSRIGRRLFGQVSWHSREALSFPKGRCSDYCLLHRTWGSSQHPDRDKDAGPPAP